MADEKTLTRKELVQAAMQVVYMDFEEYVKDQAREHTVANAGMVLEHMIQMASHTSPTNLVSSAFFQLYSDCESDEMACGVMKEYRCWLKTARKDCVAVQKKGLPLTLENSRLAWEKKGPFAKK